jgi:hypothetical protein
LSQDLVATNSHEDARPRKHERRNTKHKTGKQKTTKAKDETGNTKRKTKNTKHDRDRGKIIAPGQREEAFLAWVIPLHDRVQSVIDAYLEAIDDEAPGLVEGLYLTGSAALGDFHPHTSDIDFVAVTSIPLHADTVTAVGRAHARLRKQRSRPYFDGAYVTWDELTRPPEHSSTGPHSYKGRFYASGRRDCDPVTWHTLAKHGVRCRGPERETLRICADRDALFAWTLQNFDSYWRLLLLRARRFPHPWSILSLTSYGAVWVVLGVCRLHYTLATGRIASKEEAGRYGLQTFVEEWHRVLNEALRIRRADRARPDVVSACNDLIDHMRVHEDQDRSSLYGTPVSRRRDMLAFADMVLADATRRFARPHGLSTRGECAQ